MISDIEAPPGGKVEHFLKEVENGGVILSEAQRYVKNHPYDTHRMTKPWEINVDWVWSPWFFIPNFDVESISIQSTQLEDRK